MKFNFSLDTAIIISLIAIFLFVSGQAYLGGLLHTFYVDPIVLGFSVQDKIYWGYIKGLNPIAYSLLIIFYYFFIRYIDTSLEIRSRMSEKIANFVRKKIDSVLNINHIFTIRFQKLRLKMAFFHQSCLWQLFMVYFYQVYMA